MKKQVSYDNTMLISDLKHGNLYLLTSDSSYSNSKAAERQDPLMFLSLNEFGKEQSLVFLNLVTNKKVFFLIRSMSILIKSIKPL